MKKDRIDRIEILNRRIARYRSKLSREELEKVGMGSKLRPIPQILKIWLQLSYSKLVSISEMMERYGSLDNDKNSWNPLLNHIKRIVLHDRDESIREIDECIEEIHKGKFHFQYLSPIEQMWLWGIDGYDPIRIFNEDLSNITWDNYSLIQALVELKGWISKQKTYRYPAEEYMRLEDQMMKESQGR